MKRRFPRRRASREGASQQAATRGPSVSQAGERRSARVESLRALAALAVLVGHVAAASLALSPALPGAADMGFVERGMYGGGYGVFFFFALTGYLLFWPFVKRHWGGGDRINLGRYAANRALRILPLYFVVVVVVLAFQSEAPLGAWARFLTFTENFFPYTAGNFIGPAWSLVVELHFYLLLPLMAAALAGVARGRARTVAVALLVLGGLSLLLRINFVYRAEPLDPLWRLDIPTTFVFFVPGMLLALLRLRWEEQRPAWQSGVARNSDLWILVSLPLWAVVLWGTYDLDVLVALASFLTVGACVLPLRAGPLTNALQWRPLAWLGIASYSLYLWHVPVIEELTSAGVDAAIPSLLLIAVPACITVAAVSYLLVESPFLRLRRQWARSSATQETPHPARLPDPPG